MIDYVNYFDSRSEASERIVYYVFLSHNMPSPPNPPPPPPEVIFLTDHIYFNCFIQGCPDNVPVKFG